jgi:hypothetical protein
VVLPVVEPSVVVPEPPSPLEPPEPLVGVPPLVTRSSSSPDPPPELKVQAAAMVAAEPKANNICHEVLFMESPN